MSCLEAKKSAVTRKCGGTLSAAPGLYRIMHSLSLGIGIDSNAVKIFTLKVAVGR
jgi:hypothetical protein